MSRIESRIEPPFHNGALKPQAVACGLWEARQSRDVLFRVAEPNPAAADGESAAGKLDQARSLDVVVGDLDMPRLEGIELIDA